MADLLSDGTTKVSWLPAVATISAPTTTEINAGVALESVLTPDGLSIAVATASVDTSSLASNQDAQGAGRRAATISLTLKRQAQLLASDAVRAALVYRANGFLVVRRGTAASTAFASGQEVEVYPCTVGAPSPVPPAKNDLHKLTIPLMVSSDFSPNALIA